MLVPVVGIYHLKKNRMFTFLFFKGDPDESGDYDDEEDDENSEDDGRSNKIY